MKLVIASSLTQGEEAFSSIGTVHVRDEREICRDDLVEADALIVRSKTKVDAALLQDTSVRFVGTATAGTDHVNIDWLKEKGIEFYAAHGCNANSVTEYVLSALLEWADEERCDLSRLTLGIVGVGQVGSRLARKMKALGLQVIQCDPPRAAEGGDEVFHALEDLVEECDVISFHVPLVEDGPWPTRDMITSELVHRMRRGTLLINACRGEIVSEEVLIKGADSGKIGALVLDVFPNEPMLSDELLARCLYATPHIAGHSFEGRLNGTTMCLQACAEFFGVTTTWQPEWPRPILDLPADDELIDTFRRIYDIKIEGDRFGKFYVGDSTHRTESFNYLRRNYPLRFEADRYTVPTLTPELAALGFLDGQGGKANVEH